MFVKTDMKDAVGGGRYGVITLDNPPLNVLSKGVLTQLAHRLGQFSSDPKIQAIKLEAAPKEFRGKTYFSSGADVGMLAKFAADPAGARTFFDDLMSFSLSLDRLSKPVVAMVDGICYGGALELVLMCDQILATPRSVFAFKEINHRIFPGWGGTQRIARRMGPNRFPWAFHMVASGDDVVADVALRYGIIDGLGPAEDADRVMAEVCMAPDLVLRGEHQGMEVPDLPPTTRAHFGKGRSRKAVDLAYTAMVEGNRHPIEQGLVVERDCFLECFCGTEAQKMLTAFTTGQKPEFPPESVY